MTGNSLGNIINGGIAAQAENWIYYRSSDGEKIYKIRTDGSGREKINNDSSWEINVVGDWIYYRSGNSFFIYRIKTFWNNYI